MTEQLKLCPFCGSEDLFIDDIDYRFNEDIPEERRKGVYYAVVCFNCNARGSEKDSKNKAISAWNSKLNESTKHINEIKAQGIEWAVEQAAFDCVVTDDPVSVLEKVGNYADELRGQNGSND